VFILLVGSPHRRASRLAYVGEMTSVADARTRPRLD
jgi:hypothetical protein